MRMKPEDWFATPVAGIRAERSEDTGEIPYAFGSEGPVLGDQPRVCQRILWKGWRRVSRRFPEAAPGSHPGEGSPALKCVKWRRCQRSGCLGAVDGENGYRTSETGVLCTLSILYHGHNHWCSLMSDHALIADSNRVEQSGMRFLHLQGLVQHLTSADMVNAG